MLSTPTRAEAAIVPADARAIFEVVLPRHFANGPRALPDGVSVVFHVHGDGGGDWLVRGEADGVVIAVPDALPTDCRVQCDAALLMELVSGETGPREAFLAGRLGVRGDVGLALRLAGLLRESR
jgi:predicted lipid carrier protein YhbT